MGKRKIILAGAALIALAAILTTVWAVWFSPTKVAFVNWQISELGQVNCLPTDFMRPGGMTWYLSTAWGCA